MPHLDAARSVLAMLERISVDSIWAHRASGLRGSIWRILEKMEGYQNSRQPLPPKLSASLDQYIQEGYDILEAAASEMRGKESE